MPDSAPTGRIGPWQFDRAACQTAVDAFAAMLAAKQTLSERDDVLPFFRGHPQLAALLASYDAGATTCDRLGMEVGLYGEFVVDVIAGDWSRKAYCFVEFENATPTSLFARRAAWHGLVTAFQSKNCYHRVYDSHTKEDNHLP